MGNSFSKNIRINDAERCDEIIQNTFMHLGWRFERTSEYIYQANANMGLKSFGENIRVSVNKDNLSVESKSKFALIDWGKNQENVDLFEKTVNKFDNQNNSHQEFQTNEKNEENFVTDIIKTYKLFIADILTMEEFENSKRRRINELDMIASEDDVSNFLFSLIELKNKNILTNEEISIIKKNIKC